MEQPKNLYARPTDMNSGGGLPEGVRGTGGGAQRRGNQDNCNSIINKIQFFKN